MAEIGGDSPKPLEPDLIITQEDGKAIVSPIKNGQVGDPYLNATVSQTGEVSTGRIIRGKTGHSGASQSELQANFKPLVPEKKIA